MKIRILKKWYCNLTQYGRYIVLYLLHVAHIDQKHHFWWFLRCRSWFFRISIFWFQEFFQFVKIELCGSTFFDYISELRDQIVWKSPDSWISDNVDMVLKKSDGKILPELGDMIIYFMRKKVYMFFRFASRASWSHSYNRPNISSRANLKAKTFHARLEMCLLSISPVNKYLEDRSSD